MTEIDRQGMNFIPCSLSQLDRRKEVSYMVLRGDPVNILSYHERKKVWSVHVFYEPTHMEHWEVRGVWEVYYQKKGFPMMYAYGLPDYQENEKKHYGANEVLNIAWNNIDKYKRWFK